MFTRLITLFCLITSASSVSAKTVVLDVQAALQQSEAAQAFSATLQNETSEAEAQVRELETQAKTLQTELQQSDGLLSQEQLQQKQLQFQKVYEEFQRQGQLLQQRRASEEQTFLSTMRPKLDTVIKALIEDNEVSVILNRQSVIYVAPGMDVTPDIIKRLNELK